MSSIHLREESDSRLHLSVEPTPMTWAIAVGMLSFVIAYPLYSFDCMCMMLLVWTLGIAALLAFFRPWHEVTLDKEKQSLIISKQNAYQRYNLLPNTPVIYNFDDVIMVQREYNSIAFHIGYLQPAELKMKGDAHNLNQLVEKIRKFMQIGRLGRTTFSESEIGSMHSDAANEDSSSATSDDSFERIDAADLADYESSKADQDCDIPSETVESLSPSSEEIKELPSDLEDLPTPVGLTPTSDGEQKLESDGDSAVSPATPATGVNP